MNLYRQFTLDKKVYAVTHCGESCPFNGHDCCNNTCCKYPSSVEVDSQEVHKCKWTGVGFPQKCPLQKIDVCEQSPSTEPHKLCRYYTQQEAESLLGKVLRYTYHGKRKSELIIDIKDRMDGSYPRINGYPQEGLMSPEVQATINDVPFTGLPVENQEGLC